MKALGVFFIALANLQTITSKMTCKSRLVALRRKNVQLNLAIYDHTLHANMKSKLKQKTLTTIHEQICAYRNPSEQITPKKCNACTDCMAMH